MRVLLVVLALLLGQLSVIGPQTANAQPAQAQQSGRRVALVLGIGGYQYQSRLQATPKDARDMGALLQGLGFQLTTGTALVDPDKRTFDLAVRQFQRDATGAEMAVFYYSGHGMRIDGRNWMIPTDGRSARPSELVAQHVGLHEVSSALERAQPKLSMLILDACRNNPNQATRAAAVVGEVAPRSGLASVQAPAGTVIAYATAPDVTAADGPPGGSSPGSRSRRSMAISTSWYAASRRQHRCRSRTHRPVRRPHRPGRSRSPNSSNRPRCRRCRSSRASTTPASPW